jgi:hypothetical protein
VVPFDGGDNLLGLSLLDAWVVGTLADEQRADNAIG